MKYTANVKWNGNHYEAGEEVMGNKIKQIDGVVYLYDETPRYSELGDFTRYNWVEVAQHTVKENGKQVDFKILDITDLPNLPFCQDADTHVACTDCGRVLVFNADCPQRMALCDTCKVGNYSKMLTTMDNFLSHR